MIVVDRVEKKYLIDRFLMKKIIKRLEIDMVTDKHNGQDGYVVRSLYFDSFSNRDYQAKVSGIDNRKKIRLRIYSHLDECVKLELKEKKNGIQRKRSLLIDKEEALAIINGDYSCLLTKGDSLSETLYAYMVKEVYRPVCIVEYNRYAMIHNTNSTRVTFDQYLRASKDVESFFDESINFIPLDLTDRITMEVKYDGFLLSNIKDSLSLKMCTESSISKYIRARDRLD